MARALNFVCASFVWCFALAAVVAGCGDDGGRTGGGGVCNPSCAAGLVCCNGACVSTQINTQNCGGCGIVCAAGQACTTGVCSGGAPTDGAVPSTDGGGGGGMCTPSCSADERCCGSICSDRAAPVGQLDARAHESFANCNGCGLGCDMERASRCGAPAGGGSAQCLCGNLPQCGVGQACVQRDGTFLCANLNFDPANCGAIGNACGEGETCNMGVCGCGTGGPCAAGQACCSSTCIDTSADPMNCGACGNVCGANAPNCNSGSCGCGTGPACAAPVPGLLGMGAMPGESCCSGSCVANSTTSCACESCTGDDTCQVAGGGLIPGMGGGEVSVCCGGPEVAIAGCGGGGFPPFP